MNYVPSFLQDISLPELLIWGGALAVLGLVISLLVF
jgi:hypothetical protein